MAALGLTGNKGQGLCPEGSGSAGWALEQAGAGHPQDLQGATVTSQPVSSSIKWARPPVRRRCRRSHKTLHEGAEIEA